MNNKDEVNVLPFWMSLWRVIIPDFDFFVFYFASNASKRGKNSKNAPKLMMRFSLWACLVLRENFNKSGAKGYCAYFQLKRISVSSSFFNIIQGRTRLKRFKGYQRFCNWLFFFKHVSKNFKHFQHSSI